LFTAARIRAASAKLRRSRDIESLFLLQRTDIKARDTATSPESERGHVASLSVFGAEHKRAIVWCDPANSWGLVTRTVPGWYDIFSFVGPIGTPKAEMLVQIRRHCSADDYVMVGNDPRLYGNSDDVGAADAGWRFIRRARFRGRRSVIANPREGSARTLHCHAVLSKLAEEKDVTVSEMVRPQAPRGGTGGKRLTSFAVNPS
jgi:hypothetical protein